MVVAGTDADKWRYEITSEGGSGFRAGPKDLKVNDRALADLAGKSKNVDDQDSNFKTGLKYLGSDLLREIFRGGDGEFWGDLKEGLGRVKTLAGEENGVGRVKLCFNIS